MVMPPSVPPERPLTRRMPSGVETISSCACEPGVAASSKPSPTSTPLIAWMPISAPASRESSRRSQCTCEPRPGGSPWTTTSTTPPSVSPSLWAWSIAVDHRRGGVGVEAADRVVVEAGHVVGLGHRAGRRTDAAELDHVRDDPGADGLLEEVAATRPSATRAAVSRAEARSRIGRASSKSYFCMPTRSAWPGRGRVSGALRASASSSAGSTGSADITLLPLGPLGVADLDRDRAALRLAVADAADQRDLVLLELHPGAAAVAEPAPRERVGDVVRRHLDVGGQPLEDRDQGGAVGLARGEPTQHGASVSRRFGRRRRSPGDEIAPDRRTDGQAGQRADQQERPEGVRRPQHCRSRRTSAMTNPDTANARNPP